MPAWSEGAADLAATVTPEGRRAAAASLPVVAASNRGGTRKPVERHPDGRGGRVDARRRRGRSKDGPGSLGAGLGGRRGAAQFNSAWAVPLPARGRLSRARHSGRRALLPSCGRRAGSTVGGCGRTARLRPGRGRSRACCGRPRAVACAKAQQGPAASQVCHAREDETAVDGGPGPSDL